MKLQNSSSIGIFIGISISALSTFPMQAFAQSMGYLSAKPLGNEVVQYTAPEMPTTPPIGPVFIVPQTPTTMKVATPEFSMAAEPVSIPAPAASLQSPQTSFGPLRLRNYATQINANTQSAEELQNRGPLRAIYQDSKTALFEGLPNRIASGLPWVNHGNRGEPFESVLARVSTDLQSASAADPEWAMPAQNEIRRLAMQLDRLPAPPNNVVGAQNIANEVAPATSNRPFRPRPIWPGARANIEAQTRPTSLTTTGVDEQGSATAGENVIWQNLEPSEVAPPQTTRPNRRARR